MQILIKFQTYNGEFKEEPSNNVTYIFNRFNKLGYLSKETQ